MERKHTLKTKDRYAKRGGGQRKVSKAERKNERAWVCIGGMTRDTRPEERGKGGKEQRDVQTRNKARAPRGIYTSPISGSDSHLGSPEPQPLFARFLTGADQCEW